MRIDRERASTHTRNFTPKPFYLLGSSSLLVLLFHLPNINTAIRDAFGPSHVISVLFCAPLPSLALREIVKSFLFLFLLFLLPLSVLKLIEKYFSQCNGAKSEMSKINSFRNWSASRGLENWLIGSEQTTGKSTPGRDKSRPVREWLAIIICYRFSQFSPLNRAEAHSARSRVSFSYDTVLGGIWIFLFRHPLEDQRLWRTRPDCESGNLKQINWRMKLKTTSETSCWSLQAGVERIHVSRAEMKANCIENFAIMVCCSRGPLTAI